MGWKTIPTWLKGGIIASIIYILIAISINFGCSNVSGTIFNGGSASRCFGFAILFLAISSPGLGILSLLNINYSQNSFLVIIVTLIAYFIIGALIGTIVNKIKSRSK